MTDDNRRSVEPGGDIPGAPSSAVPDAVGEPARPAPEVVPAGALSRFRGMWIGVTFSAVVLLFLLIFILQNGGPADINFLGATVTLPVGVALLLAAVCGVLLVAIPGYLRILHLRRVAKRGRTAR